MHESGEYYVETTKENAEYTDIDYVSYTRLYTNKVPTLTCTRVEDRYTISGSLGNGELTYPVGLLTADEAFFAGGTTAKNDTYYLYSGESFFTSSPYRNYDTYGASLMWVANSDGQYYFGYSFDDYGVRPVINLRADVEFTGNGTFETPYVIKTN